MAQQAQTGQPAPQQRGGLLGAGRRSSRSRSAGGAGCSRLPGRCLLVGHGGTAVQLRADEALAAPDVVHAPQGWVSPVGQREARLFLWDGADPLCTQVFVQELLT